MNFLNNCSNYNDVEKTIEFEISRNNLLTLKKNIAFRKDVILPHGKEEKKGNERAAG